MHGTLVDVKVIKDAVRLACRAPSLHNSQPWRLDLDGKGVHLFLDTSRIMPSTDRSAREAIISCGSAARPPPGCHGGSRLEGACRQIP